MFEPGVFGRLVRIAIALGVVWVLGYLLTGSTFWASLYVGIVVLTGGGFIVWLLISRNRRTR